MEKSKKSINESKSRGLDIVHIPACEFSQSQFEILAKEKWIRTLELVECSRFAPYGLDTILKNEIESLDLRASDLSDDCLAAIARCDSLRSLSLARCTNVSPTGLMKLSRMKNLHNLDLTGVPVSDEVLKSCLENMPTCWSINISENPLIGDHTLRAIGKFEFLHSINFSHTSVSDEGLKYLGKNLAYLEMVGNKRITDKGIDTLVHKCPTLLVIHLPGTSVTAKGLMQLTKFKRLHDVEIGKIEADMPTRARIRKALNDKGINTFKF